ncbi:MAG: DUF423 domain-containing protein [Ferruginibacter sp.]
MHKGFLTTAALLGLLSVGLGAFGAHGLKGMVSDHAVATFETGVRYQFYHVFALLITAILYKEYNQPALIWAGRLFLAGILLFSGSLYVLTFIQAAVKPGYLWVGAITPFGGVAFIAGWALMFFAVTRSR